MAAQKIKGWRPAALLVDSQIEVGKQAEVPLARSSSSSSSSSCLGGDWAIPKPHETMLDGKTPRSQDFMVLRPLKVASTES